MGCFRAWIVGTASLLSVGSDSNTGYDNAAAPSHENCLHVEVPSPVNILPRAAVPIASSIRLTYREWRLEDLERIEPHHGLAPKASPSLEYRFKDKAGGFAQVGEHYDDHDTYVLRSIRIISPSEHSFLGRRFPVEVQLWHEPAIRARLHELRAEREKILGMLQEAQMMAEAWLQEGVFTRAANRSFPSAKAERDSFFARQSRALERAEGMQNMVVEIRQQMESMDRNVGDLVQALQRPLAARLVAISFFFRTPEEGLLPKSHPSKFLEWLRNLTVFPPKSRPGKLAVSSSNSTTSAVPPTVAATPVHTLAAPQATGTARVTESPREATMAPMITTLPRSPEPIFSTVATSVKSESVTSTGASLAAELLLSTLPPPTEITSTQTSSKISTISTQSTAHKASLQEKDAGKEIPVQTQPAMAADRHLAGESLMKEAKVEPEHQDTSFSFTYLPGAISENDGMIPTRSAFSYDGTFTSPPCVPSVRWFLLTEPLVVYPTSIIGITKEASVYPAEASSCNAVGCGLNSTYLRKDVWWGGNFEHVLPVDPPLPETSLLSVTLSTSPFITPSAAVGKEIVTSLPWGYVHMYCGALVVCSVLMLNAVCVMCGQRLR